MARRVAGPKEIGMTTLTMKRPDCNSPSASLTATDRAQLERTNYLLKELRCASLRARLLQSDIDAIGLALKGGLISPDQAVEHLHDVDVLRLLGGAQ